MELRDDDKLPVEEVEREESQEGVVDVFEEGEGEKKGKSLDFLKDKKLWLAGVGALGVIGVLLVLNHRQPAPAYQNVDQLSLVRKIAKENQQQTQTIVNTLAQQIQSLTQAVEKQNQTLEKLIKEKQGQKQEKKQGSFFGVPAPSGGSGKTYISYEKKQELKRESQLQQQLLKQYIQELKTQKEPTPELVVVQEKPKEKVVVKKKQKCSVVIPTGSVVEGKILHTVPAPVERGILPLPPVLLKLSGSAVTPNDFEVPLDDCYMIGKAQGDWNFVGGKELARAEIQLVKLVCVLPSGKVVERKVNAYVVDESTGIEGATGKLLDLSGEQILKYTSINTLTSFFSALAQSAQETTTTPDGYTINKITQPAKYALFSSLSKSWNEYTRFYESRLKKVNPVVLVPPKKVEVVFLSQVDLGISPEQL